MLFCVGRAEGGISEFLNRPGRDGFFIIGDNNGEI